MDRGKLDNKEALNYVLAGKSIFTIKNEKGLHFTFKITDINRIDPDAKKELWFVKVLTGADNTNDYSFLGSIQKDDLRFFYKHSPKSKITKDAQSARVIDWLIKSLQTKSLPDRIELFHEGFCGRCGRKLTVPESILSGYGPECVKFVMAA